jgi:hypothetical protein
MIKTTKKYINIKYCELIISNMTNSTVNTVVDLLNLAIGYTAVK